MNGHVLFPIAAALVLGVAAAAQDASTPPPPGPAPAQSQPGGGRGGWGGGLGMGRGLMGAVTEVAADHYTVKTEAGETWTIHYSVNTRILKQQARAAGERRGGESGAGANPPIPLKPTDIKVGDAIAAMGEVDANTKSIGAVMILQVDPERARQMREMQANHGKTWIMGKVTAIDGVKVTLTDAVDNTAHTFTVDEDTTFRKRHEPITLADIQVGDTVRAEGAVKAGAFVAAQVSAISQPPEGTPSVPRNGPTAGPPQ